MVKIKSTFSCERRINIGCCGPLTAWIRTCIEILEWPAALFSDVLTCVAETAGLFSPARQQSAAPPGTLPLPADRQVCQARLKTGIFAMLILHPPSLTPTAPATPGLGVGGEGITKSKRKGGKWKILRRKIKGKCNMKWKKCNGGISRRCKYLSLFNIRRQGLAEILTPAFRINHHIWFNTPPYLVWYSTIFGLDFWSARYFVPYHKYKV